MARNRSLPCMLVVLLALCTPWTAAAEDEIPALEGNGPFVVPIQEDSGLINVVRYMEYGGRAIAFGDIDLGDHVAIQRGALRITRSILTSIDAVAAGASKEDIAAALQRLPSGDARPSSTRGGAEIFGLGLNRPWPDARLPYEIAPSITDAGLKKRIEDAAAVWNALGLVTIKAKDQFAPGDIAGTKVLIIQSSTELDPPVDPSKFYCSSSVGYLKNSQRRMTLSNICSTFNIVHEFGHALGLQHEHGRADRGTLLSVDMSKIKLSSQSQYDVSAGDYFGTTHDLCSLEHYSDTAPKTATNSGKPEIWFTLTTAGTAALAACKAKLPVSCKDDLPGQRCAISETDRAAIKALYKK